MERIRKVLEFAFLALATVLAAARPGFAAGPEFLRSEKIHFCGTENDELSFTSASSESSESWANPEAVRAQSNPAFEGELELRAAACGTAITKVCPGALRGRSELLPRSAIPSARSGALP